MSEYNRELLEEKTKPELLAIAQEEFNLSVKPQDNKDKLIDGILHMASMGTKTRGLKNFTGFADDNGNFEVPPQHVVLQLQAKQWDKKRRPVFVSVNGKGHYIPVDVPVCIHERYYEVLKKAVAYEPNVEKVVRNGLRVDEIRWQQTYSYPFQVFYHNKTKEIQDFSIE